MPNGPPRPRAFTALTIENLKPEGARQEIPDPALAGLYIVVQPSGAKSWALRYRAGGKPRKLTLGRWPIMGVADARMAATEALQVLERGIDPAAEKQEAKKARDRDTVATRWLPMTGVTYPRCGGAAR